MKHVNGIMPLKLTVPLQFVTFFRQYAKYKHGDRAKFESGHDTSATFNVRRILTLCVVELQVI
jgi:hypothetical protein